MKRHAIARTLAALTLSLALAPPALADATATATAEAPDKLGVQLYIGASGFPAGYMHPSGPEYGAQLWYELSSDWELFAELGHFHTFRYEYVGEIDETSYYGYADFLDAALGVHFFPWDRAGEGMSAYLGAALEIYVPTRCQATSYLARGTSRPYVYPDCTFAVGVGPTVDAGARWQWGDFTVGVELKVRTVLTEETWDYGDGENQEAFPMFSLGGRLTVGLTL